MGGFVRWSRPRRRAEFGEYAVGGAFGGVEGHRRVEEGFQLGFRPRADVGGRDVGAAMRVAAGVVPVQAHRMAAPRL
ncbi:hypothetical protein OG948_55695 (plasmid) [Embleya sp. NBC_00888]|uniref:hypothetical protein n=1 Tax=Embleya sp. NBC_00888 TaxID=2975960 RepID=UPI003866A00B|nr:hypothetical protein OG948_55695 [Embleya sp. NBC_00888]